MYDHHKPFCYCVFLGVQVSLVACVQNLKHILFLIRAFDFLCAYHRCQCPAQFEGPECQQTKHSFHGNGYAWFPPIRPCFESHLSLEFITEMADGLLLYSGPLSQLQPWEPEDFMAIGNLHTPSTQVERRGKGIVNAQAEHRFSFYIILSYHKLNPWHIFYHLPVGLHIEKGEWKRGDNMFILDRKRWRDSSMSLQQDLVFLIKKSFIAVTFSYSGEICYHLTS